MFLLNAASQALSGSVYCTESALQVYLKRLSLTSKSLSLAWWLEN